MKQRKELIVRLLDNHRLMAIGTNRADGWPQVTAVGYVNDGFLIYCFVASNSQKHANIVRDPRVSIAIGSDTDRPLETQGLSLAGRASVVSDRREFEYVSRMRRQRHPEYAAIPASVFLDASAARAAPQPLPDLVVLLRIVPEIISVVDYSKGFGHSDMVTFSERDLDIHIASLKHRWDGSTVTGG